MFQYIFTILKTNNINQFFLRLLVVLCIIYFGLNIYKYFGDKTHEMEGFTQLEQFVLKRNENIYDGFYSQIYDEIHKPNHRTDFELNQIIQLTQPTYNSVFLDIGSGTGDLVNELQQAGYQAYGIDKSQAMVDISEKKYPSNQYKCGDALEPMAFEKGTFSHILCTYFTIYQMEDKRTFFKNCYHWLMPNGYLILHLVERNKFDAISPVGKSKLIMNPKHIPGSPRITNTIVDFGGFEYKSSFDFSEENKVSIVEKFQDKATKHIRQNEQTLQMETIEDILKMANGFTFKAKIDMKNCIDDENQFIYILEKI